MSDAAAAMRAAKEVQADTLAPELFRQASEWFFKAKKEYKFKNFKLARDYGEKARRFAEQAEFEALRNGGNRSDVPPDPYANASDAPTGPKGSEEPYDYPAPTGTPAESYEQRRQEEEALKKPALPSSNAQPTSPPLPPPSPAP